MPRARDGRGVFGRDCRRRVLAEGRGDRADPRRRDLRTSRITEAGGLLTAGARRGGWEGAAGGVARVPRRPGVHQPRVPGVGAAPRHPPRVRPPRRAGGERVRGELRRPPPPRVPERTVILIPWDPAVRGRSGSGRLLALGLLLQRGRAGSAADVSVRRDAVSPDDPTRGRPVRGTASVRAHPHAAAGAGHRAHPAARRCSRGKCAGADASRLSARRNPPRSHDGMSVHERQSMGERSRSASRQRPGDPVRRARRHPAVVHPASRECLDAASRRVPRGGC